VLFLQIGSLDFTTENRPGQMRMDKSVRHQMCRDSENTVRRRMCHGREKRARRGKCVETKVQGGINVGGQECEATIV